MTAYARLRAARGAAAPATRSTRGARRQRGREQRSQLYAKYPRAVPDLKAYLAYVLAHRRRRSTVDGDRHAWDARRPWRTSCGSARGHDVAVRARAAAPDARLREGHARRRPGAGADRRSAQKQGRPGVVARSTHDPLLDDFGDTSVEATALAVKALARARSTRTRCSSRPSAGCCSTGTIGRLLVEHEADGHGALRPARLHEARDETPATLHGRGLRERQRPSARTPSRRPRRLAGTRSVVRGRRAARARTPSAS